MNFLWQQKAFKNPFYLKLICPDRITVLHKLGKLDPSGCPGSTPGPGVLAHL